MCHSRAGRLGEEKSLGTFENQPLFLGRPFRKIVDIPTEIFKHRISSSSKCTPILKMDFQEKKIDDN